MDDESNYNVCEYARCRAEVAHPSNALVGPCSLSSAKRDVLRGKVSPYLVSAVVTSEDARFCSHRGVDWGEVEDALERAEKTGKGPRGASTIPMQTIKNLFLWQIKALFEFLCERP